MPNLAILVAATTYHLQVAIAALATTSSSYLPDSLVPFMTSLPSYPLQVVHFHRLAVPLAAAEAASLEVIHRQDLAAAALTSAITTAASTFIAAITFTFTSTITSSSSTTAVASASSLALAAASRRRRKLGSLRSGWRPGPGHQDPVVSQRCPLLYVAVAVVQLIGRCSLSFKGLRG